MRKLSEMEMLTVQTALEVEFDKLRRFVDATPQGYSKACYRARLDRIERLLPLFEPDKTVTVTGATGGEGGYENRDGVPSY